MKDILSTITTYREERGWTEYQLAERSGMHQSNISSRKSLIFYKKWAAPSEAAQHD